MRFTILLILTTVINCNILISASAQGNETSESTDGDADSEDNNSNNKHSLSSRISSPPPLSKPLLDKINNRNDTIFNNPNDVHTYATRRPASSSSSFSPQITTSISPTTKTSYSNTDGKICSGVHIRNDLKAFEQLRSCRVIDGPLTIALVSNKAKPYTPKDYENITFPDLIEINDYLLFFRVQGLDTLSGLFPNLSVIRGRRLVDNYALIIYEMMDLQKISLPRLSDILRGSVRIEKNPSLCYASTVNWGGICKRVFTPHFFNGNNKFCEERCPDHCRPWNLTSTNSESNRIQGDIKELGSPYESTIFCWNNHDCHNTCQDEHGTAFPIADDGGCCSQQCAGGCRIRDRSDQCTSCRSMSQKSKCVSSCDFDLFDYKDTCISEYECTSKVETIQKDHCTKATIMNLKAIRSKNDKYGRCQVHCPPGFEEDPTNQNKCKPCDNGRCRKVCTPQDGVKAFMVTTVSSLREMAGCNVINGSLEISMKGGKNVLNELEMAFKDLEEIKGYLKITRSYPILTLGFLSSLRAINGSELDMGQYSLIIIDNPNLQDLFISNNNNTTHKKLTLSDGKIFVHLNPKLCPHRIENLRSYASLPFPSWDEGDVSPYTNGDKEACSTEKLNVTIVGITANAAIIRFDNFADSMKGDRRSLLYYLINYRQVSNGTVTIFDGRDGCNNQNDVWMTMEVSPISRNKDTSNTSEKYQEVFVKTKPATRYALYIKTFTILAGSSGAISDIIYFETAPDTPGIPKQIESTAKDHESVLVSWSPPSKPNGVIKYYSVTITKHNETSNAQEIDICSSTEFRDKISHSFAKEEPKQMHILPATSQSQATSESHPMVGTCSKEVDPELQAEVVTFQDMIIEIVFLKHCPATKTDGARTRRSITDHDDQDSENHPNSFNQVRSDIAIDTTTQSTLLSKDQASPSRPMIRFQPFEGKFTTNIFPIKSDMKVDSLISGLEHYGLYTIEVVACHGDHVVPNGTKTYSRCGMPAITRVRTHAIEKKDRISSDTVKFHLANESLSENKITWERPDKPNGLILAYRVRYRPKNGNPDLWTEGCVNNTAYNRSGGFILPAIASGTYLLSVQAVTTYTGQRFWSDPELEFEIPQNFLPPIVIVALVILLIFLIGLAAASGFYYQKKRHQNGGIFSVNPDYEEYHPDEWEVDITKLIIGDKIGTGAFGMVYKGQFITDKGKLDCAIKTVPTTSTTKQRTEFLNEASIMKKFDTFHVIKLMGVISTTNPVYVIMEYMANGDLKSFLRSQREVSQAQKRNLVEGIYLMAAQIADGMAYLHDKKVVHRDLAARNCMVGSDRVVKIGDFGLTRDIYTNNYYRRGTQGRLPVKWMAPESLKDNLYTPASDVWSYGVVLWEMVTFGASPYQGMSNDEVVKHVEKGHTMSRPDNCPDNLFELMKQCWKQNDTNRPPFTKIVEDLFPLTEGKLYPNCFYSKSNTQGDSTLQPMHEESSAGAESYPLIPRTLNLANGLTNGVNHVQFESQDACN